MKTTNPPTTTSSDLEAQWAPKANNPIVNIDLNKQTDDDQTNDHNQQRHQQLSTQAHQPQRFPNNTLLEDLSKCHDELGAVLWPAKRTFRAQTKCLRKALKNENKFQMPETIRSLNLSQKDYEQALNILTSDVRFRLHILLYRRVQVIWTMLTTIFCILLPVLLFTNLATTTVITSSVLVWLCLQLTGALMTRNFRRKLDLMLEKAVAQANSYFMDRNLMLGVINVGSLLTKSRLCIPMLYFDTSQCREQIESIISVDCKSARNQQTDADGNGDKRATSSKNNNIQINQSDQPNAKYNSNNNLKSRRLVLDYSKFGLSKKEPTSGPNFAFAQSQLARKILLRYSQRWISHFDKRKLMFNDDKVDEPRHLSTGKCLCQFVEEHFKSTDYHDDEKDDHDDDDGGTEFDQNEFDDLNVDDCCSTDELTDMVDGKQTHHTSHSDCVQIDINKLASIASNNNRSSDSLRIIIPSGKDQDHFLGRVSKPTSLMQQQATSVDNYYSTLDSFVPTLSQLVSMKERPQVANADFERQTNSTSPVKTEFSFDSTTVATDANIDQSIRNDDLIKRLKDLLEMRKNELSTGSNNQHQSFASQQWCTQDKNSTSTTINKFNPENGSNNLKKFFSQTTDGLAFLGAGKQKQHQHGFYIQQRQALEIC